MNANRRGKIIVIDAIDGAGKSTAISEIASYLESHDITPSFDLVSFQKKYARLPEIHELEGAKLLLATEPTSSWIGSVIRKELITTHEGYDYSGLSAAQAFALDREILYKRVIIPFLEANPDGFVMQDRGLISSLAYQPLQDPTCTIEQILALPGNQTELSYPPDLLLLLTLNVNVAQRRLAGRKDKMDNSLLEMKDFQSALVNRYLLDEVREPFLKRGTHIVEIDASKTPEITLEQIKKQITVLLESTYTNKMRSQYRGGFDSIVYMKKLISIEEILKRSWKTVTSEWRTLLKFFAITISIPILGGFLLVVLAERRTYAVISFVLVLIIICATAYFSLTLFNYLTQYVFETNRSPWLNTQEFISTLTLGILYATIVSMGLILFIIPGIWLGVAFAFSLPIYLHEKTTVIGAMKRSWQIVQGRWWDTALRLVLPDILWFIGAGFLVFASTLLFVTCAVVWLGIMTILIHMSGANLSPVLNSIGELFGILAAIGMVTTQLATYFAAGMAKLDILLETYKSLHQTYSK